MEAKIAAILARFAANTNLDLTTDALNAANRKQAMVPEGATRSTRSAPRRAWSCRDRTT